MSNRGSQKQRPKQGFYRLTNQAKFVAPLLPNCTIQSQEFTLRMENLMVPVDDADVLATYRDMSARRVRSYELRARAGRLRMGMWLRLIYAWGGGLGFVRGWEDEIWVDERKRCELFVLVGLQKLLRYPYCVGVMCSLSVGITVNSCPQFLFLPPVEANRRRDEWNWRKITMVPLLLGTKNT